MVIRRASVEKSITLLGKRLIWIMKKNCFYFVKRKLIEAEKPV